jgi:hypothetical protein
MIREVKSFRVDDILVLTAVVNNKKNVRLAVEFLVKDAKQLRNSKSIVTYLTRNNNVEIRSITVQASCNFESDFDDAASTTAVLKTSNFNQMHKYPTAEPSYVCRHF